MTRTSFALSDESTTRELLEDDAIEVENSWAAAEDLEHLSSRDEDHRKSEEEGSTAAQQQREPFHVFEEAKKLFHIALPSVLIQFSLFFIFPMSASSVGRTLGTVELAGFSLGSLVGNLTCLSIMEGALTAADTLMPRAFGNQRYDEVARLVVRGTIVCSILLVPPIVPLCFYSEYILQSLGQDPLASKLAQEWIRMYFWGVPPNLAYRIALRFLLAQHQPWPHVYTSVIPCLVIHPILLSILVPRMGLPGSALAITLTQWSMTLLLAAYLFWISQPRRQQPTSFTLCYHPETWPGLSMRLLQESLRPAPLWRFFSLSLGGVFSLSEWWFWETMCFIAGSFGVVSLCVHTIAYNLVPLLFMLPLGIMVGLAVRMGHVISHDAHRAKLMAAWSMGFIVMVGAIISFLLYIFRLGIIRLFTNDDEVIHGCLHIWREMCCYIFLLYIFGISSAVYRGLGMQWRLAFIVTTSLYFFLLPAVVYFAMIKGGGVYELWRLLPSFYAVMQVILAVGYMVVDWDNHSHKIREGLRRSIAEAQGEPFEKNGPTERTSLLSESMGNNTQKNTNAE